MMKDTHIFDLIQEPGYEHTEQNLGELLKHFNSAFVTLLVATQQQHSMSGLISIACSLAMRCYIRCLLKRRYLAHSFTSRPITPTFCFWRLLCKLLPWTSFWQSLVCRGS